MRYALHDLHPGQFEDLVVDICYQLLGPGVQKFATGPDGGRDAKFVGVAQAFPSAAKPLSGTIIIQAKHTIDAVAKFSDSDFAGPSSSSTLSEEIPRIHTLKRSGPLDHYLLFANRRLGAIAAESIIERICKEAGVSSVHLFGVERMELHIKHSPLLKSTLSQFEYHSPLRARPDELAEVISAIVQVKDKLNWPRSSSADSLTRVAFKKKNSANGLSKEYASHIARNYLKHFGVIEKFLGDPLNSKIQNAYNDAVDEFAAKLIAHRNDFENYDKLLNYLVTVLINRDSDLRAHPRLTRTVFYFMYWSCDIGDVAEDDDATAD